MLKKVLAITNCRVSSDEQLLNNSIKRQTESVEAAAAKLGAEIVKTWSGSVSSKAGTNVKRKDLREMLDFVKANKNVKYAIFDEYDRYMRSVNEGPFFEVLFSQAGVKVWYASETDAFNGDDAMAKFMRSMSAYKAEGSNEERQRKSISGQSTALREGRYPFNPKPGYMKGVNSGIPEIHPVRGLALQRILVRIATKQVTPTQGLIELNNSEYADSRAKLRMDKFRKIATDPFYSGTVVINKQVSVHNESGLHTPLITPEQHKTLISIFDKKKKNQFGPRKNGNPEYPLSNMVTCKRCISVSTIPRYVGFKHSNGKNSNLVYHKYRCRSCGNYIPRDVLHKNVEELFASNPLSDNGKSNLIKALDSVWKQRHSQSRQDADRITSKIKLLTSSVRSQAVAAVDPANLMIKEDLLFNISVEKKKITALENDLEKLSQKSEADESQFLSFAFDFIENTGRHFLSMSKENRLRCKLLIFPAGFYVDENNKIYTPEISPLYRLATSKKDTEVSLNVNMVRVQGL